MEPYIHERAKEAAERLDVSEIPNARLGLTYAGPEGEPRAYDLYLPSGGAGPWPLIVAVASGGWYFGELSSVHLGESVRVSVRRGYAIASIAVTGSGERKFPYQVREACCALSWFAAHAAELGIDPGRIFLAGASSGGHIALMTGFAGSRFFKGELPPVRGIAAFYPVSRLGYGAEDFAAVGLTPKYTRSGPTCMDSILLGVPAEESPGACESASPVCCVPPDAPAMYLAHGKLDRVVPYTQSVALYERYLEKNPAGKARLILKDDASHDYRAFKTEEGINALIDFFDAQTTGTEGAARL